VNNSKNGTARQYRSRTLPLSVSLMLQVLCQAATIMKESRRRLLIEVSTCFGKKNNVFCR